MPPLGGVRLTAKRFKRPRKGIDLQARGCTLKREKTAKYRALVCKSFRLLHTKALKAVSRKRVQGQG